MRSNVPMALPVLAVAMLCLLGAPRAHASLYEELKQSIRDHQSGVLEEVTFTKKQIQTTQGLIAVKGRQERKQVRKANWYLSLQDDRRRIHQEMGHPTYRIYELHTGVRTELWTYPAHNRMYVFQGDKLIETRID